MFAFLLAQFGLKDLIWAGILVAALTAGGIAWHQHDVHERALGAQALQTALAKATQKAEDDRARELAQQHAADAAYLDRVTSEYQSSLDTSQSLNSALAQRLRDYESARSRGAAVPGDPATPAGPDAAPGQPSSVEDAVGRVIEAAGHDADQVIALQAYISGVCLK